MSADGRIVDEIEPGHQTITKRERQGATEISAPGVRSAFEAAVTSARLRASIVALAIAFYAVFIFRTSFTIGATRYFVLFEDAMISMRYARHLADGHGLVWNVGEPPIEGFTNLLWVLWMSVA